MKTEETKVNDEFATQLANLTKAMEARDSEIKSLKKQLVQAAELEDLRKAQSFVDGLNAFPGDKADLIVLHKAICGLGDQELTKRLLDILKSANTGLESLTKASGAASDKASNERDYVAEARNLASERNITLTQAMEEILRG